MSVTLATCIKMSFSTVVVLVESHMDILYGRIPVFARILRYSVVACLVSALSAKALYFFPSLEQGTLGHLPFREFAEDCFIGVVLFKNYKRDLRHSLLSTNY